MPDSNPFRFIILDNLPLWIQRAFKLDSAAAPRRLATMLVDGEEEVTIQPTLDVIQGGLAVGQVKATEIGFDNTPAVLTIAPDAGKATLILAMSLHASALAAPTGFQMTFVTPLTPTFGAMLYVNAAIASGANVDWKTISGRINGAFYVPASCKLELSGGTANPGETLTVRYAYLELPAQVAPFLG